MILQEKRARILFCAPCAAFTTRFQRLGGSRESSDMPFNPGRSTFAETKNLLSPERFSDSQPPIRQYISAPANLPETSKHPCKTLSGVPENPKHTCYKLSGVPESAKHPRYKLSGVPESSKHACYKLSGLPER
ncbi:hypothetical protein [Kaistella rhinocerotis]|uniref:hypothetical protein n=1 Tax=Kaistella rhinocerotis TaxID=3026437 RepID=UPI002552B20E|nr:hypothetical protein [Kaistella sp. Ran72]